MALSKNQLFLRDNFEYHAKESSAIIADIATMPKNKRELEACIYLSMMTFMEQCFNFEKIIVKSQPLWDKQEAMHKSYMAEYYK